MPTLQQIRDYLVRKFPPADNETDANIVSDLNDIHKRVFVKIKRLKNEFEMYEDTTIADQLTYSLPSDGSVDNIIAVKVAQSAPVTASTQWDTFDFAGVNDDTTHGNWYSDSGNNIISLLQDDLPITTAGLSIRIFYYKRPNALSSSDMTTVPELDEDYHDVLKFQLISELASQGDNPDTEIADFWQRKADEFLKDIMDNLSDKYNKTPTQSSQVAEYW